MMMEVGSFLKGLTLGTLFSIVLSVFVHVGPNMQTKVMQHLHHHIQAPSGEELLRMQESVKIELSQSVRVYCVIMVKPKLLLHWVTTKNTWSKHCDKAVFYTSKASKAVEAVDLQEEDEWARLRKALVHAYANAGNIRWFFVARPTTFAIIENLKYLLLGKDSSQPFYIGSVSKSGDLEYVQYDSGIVLSYETLRRLVEAFEDELKCPVNSYSLWGSSDEKELAICLRQNGVYAEHGEDAWGKGLFNSRRVSMLILESIQNHPAHVLEMCCANMAISFGDMTPEQMHVMMYGVYRLRPYGHNFHDSLVLLPPEGSDND